MASKVGEMRKDAATRLHADSHVPPQAVRSNAKRGLELRREHNRGGLSPQEAHKQGIGSGVTRASSLASGDAVSTETVKGEEGYPSAGLIAWLLWGGDAGKSWADSIVAKLK